jgi:hypothetical protein
MAQPAQRSTEEPRRPLPGLRPVGEPSLGAAAESSLDYLERSQQWSVRLEPDRASCLLDTGSFARFTESMQALASTETERLARLERLIALMGKASSVETQARARLALLLHLFLLHARAREWRQSPRTRWDRLLAALGAVLATIPPTAPPITLWLLAHYRQPLPERTWAMLEQRLSTFGARPPSDEMGLLGCWLAARELLQIAVRERLSSRVAQALRHYKLYISGRYAHAVGKGPLSVVVEDDIIELARSYPEFFDLEKQERSFFDDWLLARFSMLTALHVTFLALPPKWLKWRNRAGLALIAFIAVAAVLVGLLTMGTRAHALCGLEPYRPWVALGLFVVVLLLSACLPRVFRVLYPRLFAGAILGWSTVLGELGTHRLFAENPTELKMPQRLCHGETHYLFLLLIALPLFFLYGEAYAALEAKWQAFFRAAGVLAWAFFLVALVGSLASVGLERIVCAEEPAAGGHLALFLAGCIVSLYFTVVVHLVWGDEGMSATLAHSSQGRE